MTVIAELRAYVSTNNPEQQEIDEAAWERLLAAVRELIRSDPALEEIRCHLD